MAYPPTQYPPTAYAPQRPAVLTGIVACLVVVGILQLLVGVLLYALAFPFLVCDGFFIVLAALAFVVSAGLWQMAGWARASAIVLGIIAAILNFPLGTVPAVILLVYLYKPEVKYAFGQGPPVAPAMWGYAPPYVAGQAPYPPLYPPAYPPGYPPAYPPPAVPPAAPETAPAAPRSRFCRNCGSPLDATMVSCPSCGTPVS